MKPKYIIIILAVVTVITVFYSCKDNPVTPDIKPGRRDYTWSRDTLKIGENDLLSIYAIWGSSPNNIWVGGYADTYKNVLWHYDGKLWKKYILNKSISIGGFYGISSNDIWATTGYNSIWKFDGSSWNEFSSFKFEGYDGVALNAIDGFSENDIYAVGFAGNPFNSKRTRIVMKFDGDRWSFVNIPQLDEVFVDVKVDNLTKTVFIDADRNSNPQHPSYKYILQKDSLIEIMNSSLGISMGKINGRVYHVIGKKIYKYKKGKLQLFKDFTKTNFAGRIWGRSEKDFFGLTWDFSIAHYNGTDLEDVYQLNYNYLVADALIFDNDVFFLCENIKTNTSFILHGKLQ